MTYLKVAQKVDKKLGNLQKTICCQKLSKIAHSGHTEPSAKTTTGRIDGVLTGQTGEQTYL